MSDLAELLARRAELEKRIETLQTTARDEAIARIKALMQEYGLTVADLPRKAAGKTSKSGEGGGKTVAAQYRNEETGETWSGRGLEPDRLGSRIEAGRKIEDFAV